MLMNEWMNVWMGWSREWNALKIKLSLILPCCYVFTAEPSNFICSVLFGVRVNIIRTSPSKVHIIRWDRSRMKSCFQLKVISKVKLKFKTISLFCNYESFIGYYNTLIICQLSIPTIFICIKRNPLIVFEGVKR